MQEILLSKAEDFAGKAMTAEEVEALAAIAVAFTGLLRERRDNDASPKND